MSASLHRCGGRRLAGRAWLPGLCGRDFGDRLLKLGNSLLNRLGGRDPDRLSVEPLDCHSPGFRLVVLALGFPPVLRILPVGVASLLPDLMGTGGDGSLAVRSHVGVLILIILPAITRAAAIRQPSSRQRDVFLSWASGIDGATGKFRRSCRFLMSGPDRDRLVPSCPAHVTFSTSDVVDRVTGGAGHGGPDIHRRPSRLRRHNHSGPRRRP